MNQPDIDALVAKLDALLDKLGAKRERDIWDLLPAVTTFLGTVVLGAVGLYLTHSFQRFEAARATQLQQAQIDIQWAQSRIEELKAVTSLAPLLASTDSANRRIARQLLQAVQRTTENRQATAVERSEKETDPMPAVDSTPAGTLGSSETRISASSTALINALADIVLSADKPQVERIEATQRIGEIALARGTTDAVREEALQAATKIAASPGTPAEARRVAAEIIAGIKTFSAPEIVGQIEKNAVDRVINEIILHHVGPPTRPYRGVATVLSIAEFQTANLNWSKVSWHYAVAPDGMVWTGMELDEPATHAGGHNASSVSILLLLNGDAELPTKEQELAFRIVVDALANRLSLTTNEAFKLHRDLNPAKTCPGMRITREMVLSWLKRG